MPERCSHAAGRHGKNSRVILSWILGGLALLSLALMIWQVYVAFRFPMHRRPEPAGFAPAVTILKPLKGCDAETRECLRSWLTQEYAGPVQVVFGVASADDPVCEIVRGLIEEHRSCAAQLLICPQRLGANAKVSQLLQMQREARHELICISDADVWAPADFLTSAVVPLRDAAVGLTHSLYRVQTEANFAMRWEACAVNVDFWSQVLQSASLKPVDFALGAAMLTTGRHLTEIGGFAGLVDHLADDYELGNRIARGGRRVALCPVVVECRSGRQSLSEVWAHQLRWARTIRVCQPFPFFASILSNASLWPLLWVAMSPARVSAIGALICLFFRLQTAPHLEQRLAGRKTASSRGMPVLKDLFQVAIWFLAFTGREVTWRGVRYRVETGGKLARGRPAGS